MEATALRSVYSKLLFRPSYFPVLVQNLYDLKFLSPCRSLLKTSTNFVLGFFLPRTNIYVFSCFIAHYLFRRLEATLLRFINPVPYRYRLRNPNLFPFRRNPLYFFFLFIPQLFPLLVSPDQPKRTIEKFSPRFDYVRTTIFIFCFSYSFCFFLHSIIDSLRFITFSQENLLQLINFSDKRPRIFHYFIFIIISLER